MGLSAKDKSLCEEVFKLYEHEPGKIEGEKLGEVMRAPGANPTEEEIGEILQDGLKTEVTLSEYLAIMDKQTMHEDPRSVLDSAFTIFDAEGKGTVDTTELRSVIGNLGEGFSSEEIGQMMLMADIDSDGKMQIEDLIKFCVDYK